MTRLDVRRLAAVDMYGRRGRSWRRRVILSEFLVRVGGCLALGLGTLLTRDDVVSRLLGVWLTGIGLIYVSLALHALTLSPPGALDAELRGVEHPSEQRHYAAAQCWLAVPFAVAGLGVA
jgi:hypothetical protein